MIISLVIGLVVGFLIYFFTNRIINILLRDYFAGKALMGLIINNEEMVHPNDRAIWAYTYADAMLKHRDGGLR